MARPNVGAAKELILPVFTQWEKVGSVTGILQELEQGIFYDAALLTDQFMRDDRLRATWDVAVQSVLGMPMHFEAADHSAAKRSDKVTDEAQRLWKRMVPTAELVELLMWGFFLGVGVARKNWQRMPDGWLPVMQTWHPGALRFDLTTDQYMLRTQDQGEMPIIKGDPNWILFTPFGHKYGRLRGYMRSIAMVVLERQWAHRDRARHSEKHGMPVTQLIVPAESDQKDKDTERKAIAGLGTETVSVTPQGDKGNLYDWKFHEPAKASAEVFGGTIDNLEDCIAILLLGQKTSTKGANGLGSDANPGDVVRRDKMRFYAECIQDIGRDGVLRDWAMYNYGDADIAPSPCIEVDPPEDGNQKALELSTLGDAIDKLEKHGLDVRATLEESGATLVSEAEAEQKRQQLMQEAQDAMSAQKTPGNTDESDSKPTDSSA